MKGTYLKINSEYLNTEIEHWKINNKKHMYDLTNQLKCDRSTIRSRINDGTMPDDFLRRLCKEIGADYKKASCRDSAKETELKKTENTSVIDAINAQTAVLQQLLDFIKEVWK